VLAYEKILLHGSSFLHSPHVMTKVSIKTAGLTNQGHSRANNEDAVLVDPEMGLLIVADGMGGHKAGEVASSMAVTTIPTNLKSLVKEQTAGEISQQHFSAETNRLGFCMKMANQTIYEASRRCEQDSGMGTTCTAVLIKDDRFSLAHVGDSRCYLIRHGEIEQLTEDHSLAMEQVRVGLLSREEAAHTNQNILTRSLGTEAQVKIDLDEHPLFPGDVLVLCSDGLDKELSSSEILQTVLENSDPPQLAQRLIEKANSAGGRDNITVAVARVDKAGLGERIKSFFKSSRG
jgi:serine/threonine protein phosphatase PrpC